MDADFLLRHILPLQAPKDQIFVEQPELLQNPMVDSAGGNALPASNLNTWIAT
jgi:hypothetical protein